MNTTKIVSWNPGTWPGDNSMAKNLSLKQMEQPKDYKNKNREKVGAEERGKGGGSSFNIKMK